MLFALSALMAAAPPTAAACTACVCRSGVHAASPELEYVPRNARVLVQGTPDAHFELRSQDTTPLALETEPSSLNGWVWVRARELLSPDRAYTIESASSDDDAGVAAQPPVPLARIQVLPVEDHTPPNVMDVTIAPVSMTLSCASSTAAGVNVVSLSDAEDVRGLARYYVQLDVTIDGITDHALLRMHGGWQLVESFGRDQGCYFGTESIPHARIGAPASALVTFYDQAGNATRAGPLAFEFAEASPLGCPVATITAGATSQSAATTAGSSNAAAVGGGSAPRLEPSMHHVRSCSAALVRGTCGSGSAVWLLLLASSVVQRRRLDA